MVLGVPILKHFRVSHCTAVNKICAKSIWGVSMFVCFFFFVFLFFFQNKKGKKVFCSLVTIAVMGTTNEGWILSISLHSFVLPMFIKVPIYSRFDRESFPVTG